MTSINGLRQSLGRAGPDAGQWFLKELAEAALELGEAITGKLPTTLQRDRSERNTFSSYSALRAQI